jgi:hypothetical protein
LEEYVPRSGVACRPRQQFARRCLVRERKARPAVGVKGRREPTGSLAGTSQGVLAGVRAMATFRCSKCGCHEDTALCNYWSDRVRDMPLVCSACDPRIEKWHGQFPRLFGTFLVTPSPGPTPRPREKLASLVGRLAEASQAASQEARTERTAKGVAVSRRTPYFDDPIPSYKPLTASK